jgi:hypothetical protein
MAIEPGRLVRVDQPHRALRQPLLGKETVVGLGDDVDDGIADREHVEGSVGQGISFR